jgi:hypothetical protein
MNLKPCPFCGSEARIIGGFAGPYFVVCFGGTNCVTMGEQRDHNGLPEHRFLSKADAAEAWNRRTPEPSKQNSIEDAIAFGKGL